MDTLIALWSGVTTSTNPVTVSLSEEVAVLQAFLNDTISSSASASNINNLYAELKNTIFIDFVAQLPLGQQMGLSYNYANNTVNYDPATFLQYFNKNNQDASFVANIAASILNINTNYLVTDYSNNCTYTLPSNDTLGGGIICEYNNNSIVNASKGNDTILGSSGDTLKGGAGNDTYYVNNTNDVVVESSSGYKDTVVSSVNFTLGSNLEVLTLAESGNLIGAGNSLNDTLTSNIGADTLVGGKGNDTFYINNSSDMISGTINSSDKAYSYVNYTLGSNINNLTLAGTSNLASTANNNNGDILTANSGSDSLISGSGTDTLVGGVGNDTYYINNSKDIISETTTGGQGMFIKNYIK